MPEDPTTRAYRQPAQHRAPQPSDEVSLRDLYLILRRGLPAILGIALLVAAAASLWVVLRPPVYDAEAIVTAGTPAVRMRDDANLVFVPEGDGAPAALELEPPRPLSFDAYGTIAESRTAFRRAVELLAADGVPVAEVGELAAAASVEDVGGGANPLIVEHVVRWGDPDLAARYANAWAQATVDQVRTVLLADLEQVLTVTEATARERLADVEALESALGDLPEDAPMQQRAALERDLALARRAHASVAGLAPLASYIADLVPSATRVLDAAAPPMEPTGPSLALVATLALILGGLLGTVFVFLRAAVRDTPATSPAAPPHEAERPEAPV